MHPEPNQPDGLLAALVPFGVLVQPEVALTGSIWWLLGLEGGSGALDGLVRRNGIEPGTDGQWLTEVVGEGGRTDLEYRWGDPSMTWVVVEAKLGHTLTVDQIEGYANRLADRAGLLVVLLPEARRLEAEQVKRAYEAKHPRRLDESGQVRVDVWTYDEVTSALEAHLPGSSDVAQFKGLVQASRALDIFPMTPEQLMDDNPERREDIWRVVDQASFGLFGQALPSGSDGSLAQRRYVALVPYAIAVTVGVGRKTREVAGKPQPWAWLRIAEVTPYSWVAQSVLDRLRPGLLSQDQDALWLPLQLPPDASGAVMIKKVREDIEEVASAIKDAIDEVVSKEMADVPEELKVAVAAVMGIQPIDPSDLLDDSPTRRSDLELILREASRSFYVGRINPKVPDDDYEMNRYIQVAPFHTHICTSMGRKTRTDENTPQPWTWLRVNSYTPHAATAHEALEQLAPGQVVVDLHGSAIPLVISTGAMGPKMLDEVRLQIHTALVAIRAAVKAHQTSDMRT